MGGNSLSSPFNFKIMTKSKSFSISRILSFTLNFFFLTKDRSISLVKNYEYKNLQNYSHMLWGYIVIDRNNILTIKWYLWLSPSTNPCTKIIKWQIYSKQTRSKIRVTKYPKKKLFKLAVRDNPSHRII
jgi:hypothetical protein